MDLYARLHSMKRIVWAFAAGLVVFYAPYAGLTKAVTEGLVPGVSKGLVGLEILPAAILGTVLMVPLNLTLFGWWKYASLPSPAIALSGFGLALIIGSTTVLYTFHGISIVLALILMRGGLLIMGPIVDLVFGRHVRWFSWAAFGISLGALLVSLLVAKDHSLPLLAALNLAVYLFGYALRTPCMTKLAKVKDHEVTLRYFVQEILVTIALLPAIPALMAIFGTSSASLALRRGFTTFWTMHPAAVLPVLLIGVFYACHNVFGTLIYLDCRENTFCIPLFCGASFLAGYSAILLLSTLFAFQAPPMSQLISSGMIAFALVLLSPVHHKFEDAWAFVSGHPLRGAAVADGPRMILFVCSGNTCRSPMAAAIANTLANGVAHSAGISAREGAPMTDHAQTALRTLGVTHPPHAARPLTPELVGSADLIYAMTRGHRDAILAAFPHAAAKTHCIDPQGDVADPIGGPAEGYESTAQRLHELVRLRFDELGLAAMRLPS
jgi:protein-tyrosine-phosphatase